MENMNLFDANLCLFEVNYTGVSSAGGLKNIQTLIKVEALCRAFPKTVECWWTRRGAPEGVRGAARAGSQVLS